MNIIQTKGAPAAIGPYSQGFPTGKLLFTSGQLPVNPADGAMPEGIAAQAEWSCKNVGAILEAAGSGFEKVVKTTCFSGRHCRLCRFQRGICQVFYLQACPLLCGSEGSAQGSPV